MLYFQLKEVTILKVYWKKFIIQLLKERDFVLVLIKFILLKIGNNTILTMKNNKKVVALHNDYSHKNS